ncbi:MAG: SCO family protein, partial [Rhodospirillales bacterium]
RGEMEKPDKTEETKAPPRVAVAVGALLICLTILGGMYFIIGPDRIAAFLDPSFKVPEKQTSQSKGVSIGGPFELVDHTGAVKTHADFAGKFMLIYFGYTYCPDVCPTALTAMTDALNSLGSRAKNVTPVFITVDPKRDTVEQLKMYTSHFHPRMVGLTGSEKQIAEAAKAFRVYYARHKESEPGANDYLVDHSSIVLFMDQQGRYLTHFGHAVTGEAMAERLKKFL